MGSVRQQKTLKNQEEQKGKVRVKKEQDERGDTGQRERGSGNHKYVNI